MTSSAYPKKVWFSFVFSGLTILFLVATLFTGLTDVDRELASTVALPLGTLEFANTMESVTASSRHPVDPGLVMFNNGEEFFADLLREIAAAEHSVTLTNYVFRDGRMTGETFDALIRRAKCGVQIRLLLDGNGGKKAPQDKLDALLQAGGKVEDFRPLGFRYLTRINKRTHVRAIVIDGKVGYTGGLAFDDGWLGDGVGEDKWRDVMFKYRGAMARATQDQFSALWRPTNGEILSGPDFYPLESDDSAAPTDTVSPSGSWFVGLFHAPAPDLAADLQDIVFLTVAGSRDHLYITTPYMTPDKDILEKIMAAARRGVRVEVLMPGPYTDAKLIQAATRARYRDLLGAGVRIFEYQPGMFHAKTMMADGHWSLIGSANLDNRSATLNVENVFAVEDRRLAGMLEAEFAANKARSKEVTLENFRPNPLKTLYFNFARIFAKQY